MSEEGSVRDALLEEFRSTPVNWNAPGVAPCLCINWRHLGQEAWDRAVADELSCGDENMLFLHVTELIDHVEHLPKPLADVTRAAVQRGCVFVTVFIFGGATLPDLPTYGRGDSAPAAEDDGA